MNCAEFAEILADLQERILSPRDQAAARAHARGCESCRRLLDIAEGRVRVLSDESGRALARAIIRRTSGAACPGVESRLCDFVDGSLDRASSRLVAFHLEFCRECRRLASELSALKEELPGMAEIEPRRDFTRSVVLSTSAWRPVRPSLRTRFLAWWNRVAQRPRFSFEAAYLGTLVLVFTFANPVLPLGNTALEKLGSAGVVPAARTAVLKLVPSERMRALTLALEFGEVVSQKEKAALQSLDNLLTRAGRLSASSVHWQVSRIGAGSRKTKDALRGLLSNLPRLFSRSGS